jgi:regulatory protein
LEYKKKYIDYPTALQKMQAFCAYQERSQSEVKTKLLSLGLHGDDVEELIAALIEDNFINEERFAKAFAHGKANIKKWGKVRIKQELKLRKISDYCIRKAIAEIHDDDDWKNLKSVLSKKSQLLSDDNEFTHRQKLFQYALQKGYEIELIQSALDQMQIP